MEFKSSKPKHEWCTGQCINTRPPPTIPLCSKYEPAEVWGIVDELDECSSMNSIMESDAVPEVIQIRFL